MKVDNPARPPAWSSRPAANTCIVRPFREAVKTVSNSANTTFVFPPRDNPSNPGCTWSEIAVSTSRATGPAQLENSVTHLHEGRFYIQGAGRRIEVHSLDDWVTVLMSKKKGPDGLCLPLRYHCGYWRIDDATKAKATTPLDWLEYGLIGNQAPESGELAREIAHTAIGGFDFPPSLDGDFLKKWFIHDWFNPLPGNRGVLPAWAIKYAKPEKVVSMYFVQKLLNSGAFPCEAAVLAYQRQIKRLDGIGGIPALIYRVIEGISLPGVCKFFSSPATLLKKKQSLVPKAFGGVRLVNAYLEQFTFPKTMDGDVLKIALLSRRRRGCRTPAWAGYYVNLACCKEYFLQVESLSSAERQGLLTRVLADGCYGGDFAQAEAHLAKFAIADEQGVPNWGLLEELLLDKLLDGGRWAVGRSSAADVPPGPPGLA